MEMVTLSTYILLLCWITPKMSGSKRSRIESTKVVGIDRSYCDMNELIIHQQSRVAMRVTLLDYRLLRPRSLSSKFCRRVDAGAGGTTLIYP
jgi:hypothetical protein